MERGLDDLCTEAGFPKNEEFKWSPDKKLWMYMGLTTEDREAFFRSALELAATCGVKAVVVIEDKTKRPALSDSKNAEDDVVALLLERADHQGGAVQSEVLR